MPRAPVLLFKPITARSRAHPQGKGNPTRPKPDTVKKLRGARREHSGPLWAGGANAWRGSMWRRGPWLLELSSRVGSEQVVVTFVSRMFRARAPLAETRSAGKFKWVTRSFVGLGSRKPKPNTNGPRVAAKRVARRSRS